MRSGMGVEEEEVVGMGGEMRWNGVRWVGIGGLG